MMEREWQAVLARYGQPVQVLAPGEETGAAARAFLQPLREKGEQTVPSPLGMGREDRFLYLGPPDLPLTARETIVAWRGRRYQVQSAHPIAGAGTVHHWRAVLRPLEPLEPLEPMESLESMKNEREEREERT